MIAEIFKFLNSIWILTCSIFLLLCPVYASSEPSQIGTSNSLNATAKSSSRKSFYDTVNRQHWAFWYDGSQVLYAKSSDGVSWEDVGNLSYNSSDFTVSFKDVDGYAYVVFCSNANDYDVVARRGLLSSSSIAFDSETIILNGSALTDRFSNPSVAFDTNNHVWVTAIYDNGSVGFERYYVKAIRTTNTVIDEISTWDTAFNVSRGVQNISDVVIVPQVDGHMYLIQHGDSDNIVGYIFDGSQWSSANNGGDYSWFSFGADGVNNTVNAATVMNGELYIGGAFTAIVGEPINRIAKWDGTQWSHLGSGVNGTVNALHVIGGDLYVGGDFLTASGVTVNRIAKWDGVSWSPLGSGVNNPVRALASLDGNLYVGGEFSTAGGVSVSYIAKWNGSAWSSLDVGVNNYVRALAFVGSDLYAGGLFTTAGAIPANCIARWNGSVWSAVASGVNNYVYALTSADGNLYAGGMFLSASGVTVNRVAKWNGSSWSALGTGVGGIVRVIAVVGSDVYVGGEFTTAGGASSRYVARWNGTAWSSLGTGVNQYVYAITSIGSEVYVGGAFVAAGDYSANRIAKWTGSAWVSFGSGCNGTIQVMLVVGNDLYVGGAFTAIGNITANYIAKWNGSQWSSLGSGLNNTVYAMAVMGGDVYVGGYFTTAGGNSANRIAKWDGTTWSTLGSGFNDYVRVIIAKDTGLYVGGNFTTAGGVSANYIAYWDGANWSTLGSGLSGEVYTLTFESDDLYVGGVFITAGGVTVNRIAKWDGSSWSALGAGVNNTVMSCAVLDGNLYAGGTFTTAGGIGANYIAKWDGSSWSTLGSGVNSTVISILVVNSDLYVGGGFTSAGGSAAYYVAKWDGSSWSALSNELNNIVRAFAYVGGNLYVGGAFTGNFGSNYIAFWGSSLAADTSSDTNVSVVNDAVGNVHVLYVNASGNFYYRAFNNLSGTWGSKIEIATSGCLSPSLSLDSSSGALYAFWEVSSVLYYKKGVTPFGSVNWSTATEVYSTGVNSHINAQYNDGYGGIMILWTNGNASPYVVYADVINIKHTVSGNILRASSALSGVEISVAGLESVVSDASGDFSIADIPHRENLTLVPSMEGHTFVPTQIPILVVSDMDSADFTGVINTYTVVGSVGNSLENMQNVTIELSGTSPLGDVLESVSTDSSGAYELTDIVYGTSYTISAQYVGYTFSAQSGSIASNATHDFIGTLNTYTISGVITDGSNPIAGVNVDAGGLGTAITSSSGMYSFENIAHGTNYSISIAKTGYTFNTHSATGVLMNNAICNFTGSLNTYTIAGTIRKNGQAESGVAINGGALGTLIVDAQGMFSFTGVPYGTHYSLQPVKSNVIFTPSIISGVVYGNTTANFVSADVVNEPDPDLDPDPDPDTNPNPDSGQVAGSTISGQVVSNGNPVPDALVILNAFNSEDSGAQSLAPEYKTITDDNGRYEFRNVVLGHYNLIAQKNDVIVATSNVIIDADNEEKNVVLEVIKQTQLASTTYAFWNGYLNMQNILEIRNKSERDLIANVSVFASDFSSRNFIKRAFVKIVVSKDQQKDLLINSLAEFQTNTYGFIEITANHNLFDGAVTYYRPSELFNAQFDYAFALPFKNAVTGATYVLFNTHYPLGGKDLSVFNWLTVVNPNDTIFRADVIYYAQDGSVIQTHALKLSPMSRVDIDGGHQVAGPNRAGLIQIQPKDPSTAYIAMLARYASDYTFAFGQTSSGGSGSENFVAITNLESQFGYFEVANTLDTSVRLFTKWYTANGLKMGEQAYRLRPKGILHIPAYQLLPTSTTGTLILSSDAQQALVGQMAVYEHRDDFVELTTVEHSPLSAGIGTDLFGSYNLYLGMSNWLRVFNLSSNKTSLTLKVAGQEMAINLAPYARKDLAIHSLNIPVNTYGT